MIYEFDLIRSAIRTNKTLTAAVQMLFRARQYAQRGNCNPWAFAVELEELHRTGVSRVDLRWLLIMGLVEHAQEICDPSASGRKFKRLAKHMLPSDSCFVLSDFGTANLSGWLIRTPRLNHVRAEYSGSVSKSQMKSLPIELPRETPVPEWDTVRRELRLGQLVIKKFLYSAPNQEAILSAFQEEQWPVRIDDPIQPAAKSDSRERLRNTIKCLNRNHANSLLLFRGDGTGLGVLWQARSSSSQRLR